MSSPQSSLPQAQCLLFVVIGLVLVGLGLLAELLGEGAHDISSKSGVTLARDGGMALGVVAVVVECCFPKGFLLGVVEDGVRLAGDLSEDFTVLLLLR